MVNADHFFAVSLVGTVWFLIYMIHWMGDHTWGH